MYFAFLCFYKNEINITNKKKVLLFKNIFVLKIAKCHKQTKSLSWITLPQTFILERVWSFLFHLLFVDFY